MVKPLSKRVVLEHLRGKFAGLFQILGTDAEFASKETPVYIEEVDYLDHKGAARLKRVTPRYFHYIEAPPNRENAFMHKDQR